MAEPALPSPSLRLGWLAVPVTLVCALLVVIAFDLEAEPPWKGGDVDMALTGAPFSTRPPRFADQHHSEQQKGLAEAPSTFSSSQSALLDSNISLFSLDGSPLTSQAVHHTFACSNATFQVTLVTAFFRISDSQHPKEHYYDWAEHGILAIATPMVFFTNDLRMASIRQARADPALSMIIWANLTELDTYVELFPRIAYLRTPEVSGKSSAYLRKGGPPALFIIWNAKPEVVRRAIHLDPFKTPKFMWVDVGCLRVGMDRRIDPRNYMGRNWPSPERVPLLNPNGRVVIQSIGGYREPPCDGLRWIKGENTSELVVYNSTTLHRYSNITHVHPVWHFIMGAWFVGDREPMLAFEAEYRRALHWYFFSHERPNGTMEDQYVMLGVACTRPDLLEVLRPTDGTFGRGGSMRSWFWYLEFARNGYL